MIKGGSKKQEKGKGGEQDSKDNLELQYSIMA
jgi:hypothetical protein